MIFLSMTLMIIIFPFLPKPKAQKFTSKIIQFFLFCPIKVKGEIDPNVQMFLLNHESDLDIGIMENITSKDLAWVAKKELFDVPFYGLLLKLPNDIAVERESKTALIKLLKDSKDRLDDGRVITIFPEGTRSNSGKMRKFKPGAKMIADKNKLCVQPIILVNTSRYYNIKKKHYAPGRITAVILESFIADKSDKEWLNNLKDTMQKVYDEEVAQLPS
jgi:1-acyl-sn-glycerol-3-phosphate acyltransferase